MLWLRNKKIIFRYTLLSGGLDCVYNYPVNANSSQFWSLSVCKQRLLHLKCTASESSLIANVLNTETSSWLIFFAINRIEDHSNRIILGITLVSVVKIFSWGAVTSNIQSGNV